MRNILIILLLLLFWSCASCNSEKPDDNSDSDVLSDSSTDSADVQDLSVDKDIVQDAAFDLSPDSDIAEDDSNIPDVDTVKKDDDTQPDETETPDYDYPSGTEGDPDCPSLLNAGFPYEDKDGKITFCRKCDLPASENDPQCVRNLWEMNNRRIVEEYPDHYCYPLPCDVSDKVGVTVAPAVGKCDIDATGKIYQGSTGIFKQGDISDGKIGMYVTASKKVDGKYLVVGSLLYDIATQKYTMVAHARDKQAYRFGRFLFKVGNTYDGKTYIASALKIENGWKYEAVYTNQWEEIEFIYPPAVGENYVLMNVHRAVSFGEDAGPQDILYASVKDWNWKKLGEGQIIYSQIHGDTAFFGYNGSVWACDLAKSPTNIETDCRKVNRDGKKATSPAVKKDDPNLVIYTAEAGYRKLYMANLTNEEIVYTELDIEKPSDLISFAPGQWNEDILVFDELYQFSEVDVDYRTCYYSISKEKKACFPNPTSGTMGYIYAGVEGKYITYQPTGAIILKDMECYCAEYPDQCLYDEYMPEAYKFVSDVVRTAEKSIILIDN